MKHLILLVLAVAVAPMASAQLYKYVDKDGKTVYSDQPPANVDSKQLRVPSSPPAASPATGKAAPDKGKDGDKGGKEQAKKSEQAAKAAQAAEERCSQARSNFAQYDAGGRFTKRLESGERVFLEDSELAVEKEKARMQMQEACKKS